ncbi:MAG: RNA polymerase sigma factor [Sneathiella sp.]
MMQPDWLEIQFSIIRPRALAALTRQFRDLEIAEESFAISCERALKNWPARGLPDDPFAWLLTVSRNAGRDILRKQSRHYGAEQAEPSEMLEELYIEYIDNEGLRDDVLRLLFICCHPALTPQDQSAVALRIVTGMSVEEISGAFLIKPKTMEQRITRAKRTIASANTPFETPDLIERSNRLNTVMLMLYLTFNEGWSASSGETHIKLPLCNEAIRLCRLLLDLFPSVSELMGLLSLFLFQHSRWTARISEQGNLIPLEHQDRTKWDHAKINEAHALLEKALRHGTPGSYQVQAAIASEHARNQPSSETDWVEIERLYRALYLLEPTPVIKLNHATAIAKTKGPRAAIDILKTLEKELAHYRWYHSALGGLYEEIRDFSASIAAYNEALLLNPTKQETQFLADKISMLEKNF